MSAAIGELMGRVFNRYTGLADLAPGFVALEDGLLRWLASLFCLPANANGLLTTGGSQAMLSMILAAREQHASHGDLSRARIYVSDQAHHCVQKAARIAGFSRPAPGGRCARRTRIRYGMYPYTRPRTTVTGLPPSQLTALIPNEAQRLVKPADERWQDLREALPSESAGRGRGLRGQPAVGPGLRQVHGDPGRC